MLQRKDATIVTSNWPHKDYSSEETQDVLVSRSRLRSRSLLCRQTVSAEQLSPSQASKNTFDSPCWPRIKSNEAAGSNSSHRQ